MRKLTIRKIWILAYLMAGFMAAGCGREQAPSPAFPTVIATFPANGATAVVLNTAVTANFSSVMAPSSINATTFTLTGPGATAVAGTVTYAGTTATFTPAVSLAANTVYIATITTGAHDPGGNPLAANFAWSFTTGPPTIISTIPAALATGVAVNTTVSATFSEAMNGLTITNATFTLAGPGATPVAGAVTYSGSTATFTPTLILANSTLYTATITTGAMDNAGAPLAANFVWTFTTAPPPTVASTIPANLATAVAVNTPISATFSGAMNPATINGATFVVTGPGNTPIAGAVTYTGSTATFTPTLVLPNSALITATVTTGAKDPTGAPLAANFVWTFTTAPPPAVVSTVPASGAVGVADSATVSATFNVPMNATTINTTTFTLAGPGATAVAGGVMYVGNTATFTPGAPLTPSTLYTATITSGAKDTSGTALNNTAWTFTTASMPAVTSTIPANGDTNVPLNQKLLATFSVPMSAATITPAGTFTLAVSGVGGAAVAGTVTYDPGSNSATFTPTAALTANTHYTATITTAAQSAQGNPLAANYAFSFTTGQVANAIAPTVIFTDPANLANPVPLNQRVAATFSAPMDPATISAPGTFALAVTAGGVPVPGTVSYAGATAVFTPTADLAPITNYTATITTAAKNLVGVAMVAPFTWTFTTGDVANAVAPTITSTNPASAAMAVPIDHAVSATFSAPMNPTTITNASFTLAVAGGGASVNGTVIYDPVSQIATFTPSANLLGNTTYTATISNQAQDLSGNSLGAGVAPNPWSFTTGNVVGTGQAAVNLGTAGSFAVMATSSITSTGPVIVNGDVGLNPGASQGIPPAQVNGTIHIDDPVVIKAQSDLLAAYNDAVSRSANAQTLVGNMGGLTFTPGLYSNSTTVMISGAGANNNVTLDAQGDPNAVFIFQVGSSLTTGTSSQVILINGAQAANVFWQVAVSATLGVSSTFEGNLLAGTSITLNGSSTVLGRLFSGAAGGAGTATVNGTSVTVPAP